MNHQNHPHLPFCTLGQT